MKNSSSFFSPGCRIAASCVLLLILFTLACCFSPAKADNLLTNGGFEEVATDGLPAGWTEDAYILDTGYTIFSLQPDESRGGSMVASIQNIGANDARFAQRVRVEPESLYRFSGYVRADAVEGGRGANFSIEGLYGFSESIYETDGEWAFLEWYGETGENQEEVTLFARLGGYSGESIGQVWFDDLCLEQVSAVPDDDIASLWYSRKTISYYDDEGEEDSASSASAAWPRLIVLSLGYAVIAILLLQSLRRNHVTPVPEKSVRSAVFLAAGLLLALLLRMVLSWMIDGYAVDVNCFTSWGYTMSVYGPLDFYPATSFCDYPPAYTYVLGLNSLICQWIPALSFQGTNVVFRFFPSLCDILSCVVVYRFIQRREPQISPKKLTAATLLLAFHPVAILNSAAWGQMDSVLSLLLLLVAIWAIEEKWMFCLPCYMLAVLVKPQALMLGFLGVCAVLVAWIRDKARRKEILRGLMLAVILMLLIVIPFGVHQNNAFTWIIEQYAGTLQSYPYAAVNTANFWYLAGGNWRPIGETAPAWSAIALSIISLVYGVYYHLKTRKRFARTWIELSLAGALSLYFLICAFAGFSWGATGTGAMVFAFLIVLSLYIRKKELSFLPYLGGLLFAVLYVFGVKMHERYIFPAFLLFALAWALRRDRRILIVLLGLTCTTFINEGIVLDNSIRLGSALGHLNQDTGVLAMFLSAANCAFTLYAVYVGVNLLTERNSVFDLTASDDDFAAAPAQYASTDKIGLPLQAPDTASAQASGRSREMFYDPSPDRHLHWKKADTVALTVITVLYAAVSLLTLGSTKAPQTAWTSSDYGDMAILDLGEEIDNFTMLYFARVSRYDFSVAVSDDGVTWEDETWAQMDQGQCWKWKYVTESSEYGGSRTYSSSRHWFSGRYVRITAHQINLNLCEIIFRDPDGNQLPVSLVRHEGGEADSPLYSDPAALLDEQDSMEGLPVWFSTANLQGEEDPRVPQPSWWNSTYFDEIYHARTAWEFLQGETPYETSHPPLGKILMSWGVSIFGMAPFGWRFAGALAGILMLGSIYLVARQLTKSTWISALSCTLLALDCMHLTQTQIATIDSFPVLFILMSFFFMLRFLQTDWRVEKLSAVLRDLFFSGLFMGLAIASKWIGVYAGAGLAVLFFWHGGRMLILNRKTARDQPDSAVQPGSALRRFLFICLWCILFFVAVPLIIYLLSYIPYFAYRHFTNLADYLEAVIRSQEGMLNYHATPGLGMDHPFYSPWYEWPVIGKPMFYAIKSYIFSDQFSFSIFCFGNPVIWWAGIPAMILSAWMWVRNRSDRLQQPGRQILPSDAPAGVASKSSSVASEPETKLRFVRRSEPAASGLDVQLVFLLVGFLAQYLPWTLVPRGTYIYHYFASVPFLILAISLIFHQFGTRCPRAGKTAAVFYVIAALGMMVLLFPYVSGILSPVPWLNIGRRILNIWY